MCVLHIMFCVSRGCCIVARIYLPYLIPSKYYVTFTIHYYLYVQFIFIYLFCDFPFTIQVHKKICIPLPGIFQRGRLYKAQSCSSIVRDKVIQSSSTNLNGNNNTPNIRHSALFTNKSRILSNCLGARLLGGSDGDINQPQQYTSNESNTLRLPDTISTTSNVTNANESHTNTSNALFGVSPSNTKTPSLCNNNYLMADCPCVPSNAIVLR